MDVSNPPHSPTLPHLTTSYYRSSNGLPLLSQLHNPFDARLVSIHPKTKRVRAFVPYDVLIEHHGHEARVPVKIDEQALQHHYDMCCIENMVAPWIPSAPNASQRNDYSTTAVPVSSNADTQAAGASPDQSAAREMRPPAVPQAPSQMTPPTSSYQAHPISPPCSDTDEKSTSQTRAGMVEGQQAFGADGHLAKEVNPVENDRERIWLQGAEVITKPQQAEELLRQGWILKETHREYKRPRDPSRKRKWMCGALEIDDPQKAADMTRQGWILYEVEDDEDDEKDKTERRQASTDRIRQWLRGIEKADDGLWATQGSEGQRGLLKRGYPAMTDDDAPAKKQRV